ncbi:MAG: Carbon-nitrogen hydrolase [Thelocarpon superellum]|nr:MAG: Carbon-nitrogen hydrolase [Thelocarpon superellum]
MRLACLQMAGVLGDVEGNISRANALLEAAKPTDLDLLMLPELAFSGYNHPSLAAITPYLEPTSAGPSTRWAVDTARRLRCHVSVGYPEIVAAGTSSTDAPVHYNAVVLVSPDGAVVMHYRKRYLYYTDETWAKEGDADFSTQRVTGLDHDVTMGICMDLNTYRFEPPYDRYDFSTQATMSHASLVLMTMAWLSPRETAWPADEVPHPDNDTIAYWLWRLTPLAQARGQDEVIVVLCNRSGIEGEAHYAGSSAVMGMKDGEVTVYGVLGRGVEELLVADTTVKRGTIVREAFTVPVGE